MCLPPLGPCFPRRTPMKSTRLRSITESGSQRTVYTRWIRRRALRVKDRECALIYRHLATGVAEATSERSIMQAPPVNTTEDADNTTNADGSFTKTRANRRSRVRPFSTYLQQPSGVVALVQPAKGGNEWPEKGR